MTQTEIAAIAVRENHSPEVVFTCLLRKTLSLKFLTLEVTIMTILPLLKEIPMRILEEDLCPS